MRQLDQFKAPPLRPLAEACSLVAEYEPTSELRCEGFGAADAATKLPQRPDPSVINETIPLFYIGRNKAGLWVARESQGRSGGLFLLRRSALRFAKAQSEPAGCAMMFLNEPLEFHAQSQADCAVVPFAAPRHPASFAAFVATASAAGRKLVMRLKRAFVGERTQRGAIEKELFRGR
jgi:hypothetical protein